MSHAIRFHQPRRTRRPAVGTKLTAGRPAAARCWSGKPPSVSISSMSTSARVCTRCQRCRRGSGARAPASSRRSALACTTFQSRATASRTCRRSRVLMPRSESLPANRLVADPRGCQRPARRRVDAQGTDRAVPAATDASGAQGRRGSRARRGGRRRVDRRAVGAGTSAPTVIAVVGNDAKAELARAPRRARIVLLAARTCRPRACAS